MVASIISGKLYFVNESSGEELVIAYRSVSVGLSRGLPVGVSWSKKSDPSGDVDNVISVADAGISRGRARLLNPVATPARRGVCLWVWVWVIGCFVRAAGRAAAQIGMGAVTAVGMTQAPLRGTQ